MAETGLEPVAKEERVAVAVVGADIRAAGKRLIAVGIKLQVERAVADRGVRNLRDAPQASSVAQLDPEAVMGTQAGARRSGVTVPGRTLSLAGRRPERAERVACKDGLLSYPPVVL